MVVFVLGVCVCVAFGTPDLEPGGFVGAVLCCAHKLPARIKLTIAYFPDGGGHTPGTCCNFVNINNAMLRDAILKDGRLGGVGSGGGGYGGGACGCAGFVCLLFASI